MPTPSTEKVRTVMDELITLDPSLREYGKDLERAVEVILAAKPDVNINPQFAAALRTRLMKKVADRPMDASASFTQPTFMEKLSLKFLVPIGAVATVAVIAAVVVTQPGLFGLSGPSATPPVDRPTLLASGVIVTHADANAFGNLSGVAGGYGGDAALGAPSARSQSGGGGMGAGGSGFAYAVPAAAPMIEGPNEADLAAMTKISGSATAPSIGMIAPDYTYERIRYTYDGPELQLDAQGNVYRRVKRPLNASDLGSALSRLSLGMLDLSRFGNLNLQQFSLVQSGEYGYQIYVDMVEGNVNINQNWNTWPRPETACRDEACYERLRIKPSDIPDDAALIAIVDAFLAEHGIAKDSFAAPVVDRRWNMIQPFVKTEGAVEDAKRLIYAPESVTVMYPLKLDETMVNDQSGFAYGLSVSVDARSKRVSNVWNLTTREYQSSQYDLVTDTKQVLDIASRGDVYAQPFGQDPNERIRDLKLGEPTRVLMQSWRTTENGMGEEIYVPALRFPVIPDADGYTGYRDAVVVPLAKDLIEPIYRIMGGMGGAAGTMEKIAPGVMTDPAAVPLPTVSQPPMPATEPKP